MNLHRALEVALDAARAARLITLKHFRGETQVSRKSDDSPVTQADREAETAIIATIKKAFPEHTFLAEESSDPAAIAASPAGGAPRWIIDPIDGTRGYIRGIPFWGTLIGLEADGQRVLGVLDLPALGETYFAARGLGAFCGGERLKVSTRSSIGSATLLIGEIPLALKCRHGLLLSRLLGRFDLVRCYGDCYAPTYLLRGQADVWIEPSIRAWDVAAIEVLVEEAGGKFTSFTGEPTCFAGNAMASNGVLHPELLEALAGREVSPA